jgi:hypothetical protein
MIFRIKHGFPIEDTWSLDYAFILWMAPRMRHFADKCVGTPGFLGYQYGEEIADDLWRGILAKIADGFERASRPEYFYMSQGETEYFEECLDLFREYFFNLWD